MNKDFYTVGSGVKQIAVAVSAAALAFSCVAGANIALAQDDEEEAVETTILKGLLGIKETPPIDYRERAPLVVPPAITACSRTSFRPMMRITLSSTSIRSTSEPR